MNHQTGTSAARRCICANIRRTDRAITQFYDAVLGPSGLSAPQFGLLSILAEVAPITINHFAESMAMDRTTLTRNLELLTEQHLIRSEPGVDRRMRLLLLTEDGEQALAQAWPLWQKAQDRIERTLGPTRFDALLAELSSVVDLTK